MNYSKLKQFVEKESFVCKDFNGVYAYSFWLHGYVSQRELFHPDFFSYCLLNSEDGHMTLYYSKSEAISICKWAITMYAADKSFFDTVQLDWGELGRSVQQIQSDAVGDVQHQTKDTLAFFLSRVKNVLSEMSRFGAFFGVGEVYAEEELASQLRETNDQLSYAQALEMISVMTAQLSLSSRHMFEKAKAELILGYPESVEKSETREDIQKSTGFYKNFSAVLGRYAWIDMDKSGASPYDEITFLATLKKLQDRYTTEELKAIVVGLNERFSSIEKKQHVYEIENQFTDEIKDIFAVLRNMSSLHADYQEMKARMIHVLWLTIRKLSHISEIPVEILEWATIDELIAIARGEDVGIIDRFKKRRNMLFVAHYSGDQAQTVSFENEKQKDLVRLLCAQNRLFAKGLVVSGVQKGELSGTVVYVQDPLRDEIQKGDILIAESITPDFTPLLTKVKAVVVDQGGLTSHAAILTREFDVPCIVGAKNATSLFKTGDQAVLDLNTGKVHKA